MKAPRIIPAVDVSPPTAFLGISGILHPSESTYELVRGCSPWSDGHSKYEGVPILEAALASWPDVRIVLTSTQPCARGLDAVLEHLGASLAGRVAGFTYEDLTTKVKREVGTRSGTTRTVCYSSNDYWRMNKGEIVATHVAWSRPERWMVIDDEDILWPQEVRRDRLVLTDGCVGLRSSQAQDRLLTVMLMNFGR
jgi:hypothetical protein